MDTDTSKMQLNPHQHCCNTVSRHRSSPPPPSKKHKFHPNDEVEGDLPAPAAILAQDDYADKHKLAVAKEFHIQRKLTGKRLGCGVLVRSFPRECRFYIRIYDNDRCDNKPGQLRKYVQISWNSFTKIKHKEDNIIHYLSRGRRRPDIVFNCNDCIISTLPPQHNGHAVVEFASMRDCIRDRNSCIYMNQQTFATMMSCEKILRKEYEEFQKRNEKDKKFMADLANVMAYDRNERRMNSDVNKPAEWFTGGVITTWKKFQDQVDKKMNKTAAIGYNLSQ